MKKKKEHLEQEGNLKGNTKLQISQAKRWCLTYHKGDIEQIEEIFKCNSELEFFVVGQEYGKSGETPHLQGYIENCWRMRPSELKLDKKIHWEKAEAGKDRNIIYCCKEAYKNGYPWISNDKDYCIKVLKDYLRRNTIKKPIKILDEGSLYRWQQKICSIVDEDPCERTIYWYWSINGNIGKSTFTKYLALKYDALILSGNASDMKYAVLTYVKESGQYPNIIILDIARNTKVEKLSYSGIEEVKNGCFFSGKYESGMVVGNCPHFIIFSNSEPCREKLSADRWNITNLDGFSQTLQQS